MKRKFARLALSVLPGLLLGLTAAATAQTAGSKPIVIRPLAHDVSQPLSETVATAPIVIPSGQRNIPLRSTRAIPGANVPVRQDSVLQTLQLPLIGTTPGLNFDGVGANGFAPPDTNGSVGTTQFMQITNVEFAIYDKSNGNLLLGPALIHTIWNGFGGDCDTKDGGDPVVLFDKAAQRWVVSQLSGSYQSWCMAVSTSSDATGTYNRYAFPSNGLDDYPKLAVWPDAYYRASNTFTSLSGGFVGANACAFDRATMLAGGAANEICFQKGSDVASLLPSDLDGATTPPSGEPNIFVELLDTSHLGLFRFHVDFNNPANSTFTGPTTIAVAPFTVPGRIPEPSGQGLDSLGDRLMFRLAYRNFGDHEALVVTHSVALGPPTFSVGTRWYEIRDPNGTPSIFQQGTFAPDSLLNFRWMGSIAMDRAGDMALGYSVASSALNPAIRYTGRTAGDPLGAMETEASIIEGAGQQLGLTRWGDYSSMSIDPTDDCTFWYTNQYQATDGAFNWSTRIGSFKFPNCGVTPPDFYLTSSAYFQTVIQGNSITYSETVNPFNGYSGTVSWSVSGCPTGATCTLNPTSSGSPSYPPSTLTVATTSATPVGNYNITITGTDGTLTHTTSVSLTVIVPDFKMSMAPAVATLTLGQQATFKATLQPVNFFTGSVQLTISGCPSHSTCIFNPNPVTLTYPSFAASFLTVSTTHKTRVGTYTITITGAGANQGSFVVKHSATVILQITKH